MTASLDNTGGRLPRTIGTEEGFDVFVLVEELELWASFDCVPLTIECCVLNGSCFAGVTITIFLVWPEVFQGVERQSLLLLLLNPLQFQNLARCKSRLLWR